MFEGYFKTRDVRVIYSGVYFCSAVFLPCMKMYSMKRNTGPTTEWRFQVGGSLGLEIWSSDGRASAQLRGWTWDGLGPGFASQTPFGGASQRVVPHVKFQAQQTHLPNSVVHLKKLVILGNMQRKTPVCRD